MSRPFPNTAETNKVSILMVFTSKLPAAYKLPLQVATRIIGLRILGP